MRTSHGHIRHKLVDIVVITLCSTICGGEDFNGMATFSTKRLDFTKRFLDLPSGIPDSDTFRRTFECLYPSELAKCLVENLDCLSLKIRRQEHFPFLLRQRLSMAAHRLYLSRCIASIYRECVRLGSEFPWHRKFIDAATKEIDLIPSRKSYKSTRFNFHAETNKNADAVEAAAVGLWQFGRAISFKRIRSHVAGAQLEFAVCCFDFRLSTANCKLQTPLPHWGENMI